MSHIPSRHIEPMLHFAHFWPPNEYFCMLATTVDALCDGFLIGISAASGKNAGLILAIALTIEMGFLSITLTMAFHRIRPAVSVPSCLLPPLFLMIGGVG
mmetsp:Transcript_10098/g.26380  ORF Transcript_10098/g.26380 Transcript_10098/m.26380 type:complete len:100 (-) Transcript_10098:456-755(-)